MHYDLSSAALTNIGKADMAIENPLFSLDGDRLFYFQRPADGPHQAYVELVSVSQNLSLIAISIKQMDHFSKKKSSETQRKLHASLHCPQLTLFLCTLSPPPSLRRVPRNNSRIKAFSTRAICSFDQDNITAENM